jgi:hypothetical protein
MDLRNVGILLQKHTASQPGRPRIKLVVHCWILTLLINFSSAVTNQTYNEAELGSNVGRDTCNIYVRVTLHSPQSNAGITS